MARIAVGVDIGHQQVKVVRLVRERRALRVEAAQRVQVPPGAVESGRIASREALRQALAEAGAVARRQQPGVVVGMKSPDFVVRTVRLPAMSPQELKEAVRWEMMDLLQLPAEQADEVYVDYHVLSPAQGGSEGVVGAVAVRRSVVREVVQLLREVGLPPEIMEVNAFAVARLLPRPGRVCYVDLGAVYTELYVTTDGRYELHRLLPLGCDRLTEAIAAAFGISKEEAESRKRQRPLGELLEEAVGRSALSGSVQTLLDALVQTLEYLRPRNPSAASEPAVDGLLLAGGGALQQGMAQLLTEELGYPAEVIDPLTALQLGEGPGPLAGEAGPAFAAALGLALRGVTEP